MIQGGCLCGDIRYRAGGPPLWCSHCHCEYCRRAHAAALVTWFGVEEARFELVRGEVSLRWYQASPYSRRGFCPHCGTTLLFTSSQSPGEVHIALASTDEDYGIRPQAHVFYDQHVSWLTLGDTLPRLDADAAALSAYRIVPPPRSPDGE